MIKRFVRRLVAIVAVAIAFPAAAGEALSVGIIPYLTPNVLMKLFQPVRHQLEKELGQTVELYSMPDVRSFVRRTLTPDYDFVITAAHQARLAQLDGGYLPLARFTGPLHATLVVAADSPINQPGELRGKRIAVTDRSILVNIAMIELLASRGIREADVQFTAVNSQNAAIFTVARGDADAAIIAHFTLDQSPEEQRRAVRSILRSPALPNVVVLASPRLDVTMRERAQRALLNLGQDEEGRNFLEHSRFGGVARTDESFMKSVDPYLRETRRHLGL